MSLPDNRFASPEVFDTVTVHQLAVSCRATPEWVGARAAEGVIDGQRDGSGWRFRSTTVVRVRRIAQIEQTFDADPHLAAMTADLIEEVVRLRSQVRALTAASATGAEG